MDLVLGLFFLLYPILFLFSFPNFHFSWDEYFYYYLALWDFLLCYKDEDNYHSSLRLLVLHH